MIAALDTRRAKEIGPGAAELRVRWAHHAEEIGFDPARLRDAIGRAEPAPITDAQRRAVEDRMLGADGLTAHHSTFDRNDIVRAWCDALRAGAPIGRIDDFAEHVTRRMETVP